MTRFRCDAAAKRPTVVSRAVSVPLQFLDVQDVLWPAAGALHGEQVVDGGDGEGPVADRHVDGAAPELFELVAVADEEVDLGGAVGRAEVEGEHVLLDAPAADVLDVANALEGFGNPWAGAEGPEQIDGGPPGIGREAGHDVEVERDPGAAVEDAGDPAGDHEVDAVVVKLSQDLEKPAGHDIVVPSTPDAGASGRARAARACSGVAGRCGHRGVRWASRRAGRPSSRCCGCPAAPWRIVSAVGRRGVAGSGGPCQPPAAAFTPPVYLPCAVSPIRESV